MFRRLIACLTFILVIAGSLPAYALTVQNIRAGAHPDKMRLVIELDQLADFQVSLADQPRRLVVELPPHQIAAGANAKLTAIGITGIQQENAGASTGRLVFLLNQPVRIMSAFMLPRDGPKPDRLVVDYQRIGSGDFHDATDKAIGTLGDQPPPFSDSGKQPATGFLGVLPRLSSEHQMSLSGVPVPGAKPAEEDSRDRPSAARRYVVVIDAGHGGKDPGAIGVGRVQEKNVTLAAARELARQLAASGRYQPFLTRDTDTFLKLGERVTVARRHKADLFISIHADMAAGGKDVDGLSLYTLSDTASDEQTEKLAARENKVDLIAGVDLSNEMEDVANILIDLAMRENMNQSRFLAGRLIKTMTQQGIPLLEKPQRYAGFAVLKAPDVPSVLVEMGFLSNPSEARRLQDENYRRRLMQGLVRGVDAYFDQLEKNQQF